jgi:prepilin-type N-terminal cleavage/methylation domain-containing protein
MNTNSRIGESANQGFTLSELLVVITLIAVLATLVLPALSRAKYSAKSAACKSNLCQLGIGLSLDLTEFTGEFAPALGGRAVRLQHR